VYPELILNQKNLILIDGSCRSGYVSPIICYRLYKILRRILTEWHYMTMKRVVKNRLN